MRFGSVFFINTVLLNLILFEQKALAQTYIGPLIGYDFQRVASERNNCLDILNKGFTSHSPVLGMGISQKLFRSFYLRYSIDYTRKRVHGYHYGVITNDYLYSYNIFRNNLSLRFLFGKKFYIGYGQSINIISNFKVDDLEHPTILTPSVKNFIESNFFFTVGLIYRNFDLELYYSKRSSYQEGKAGFHYGLMKGIDHLGIRLGYEFQLFKAMKSRKKLDCPDFKS